MLQFNISWNNEFCDFMNRLKDKYGEELFNIDGIGENQTDLHKFSKRFFSKRDTTLADISIDSNANCSGKSSIEYSYEFSKSFSKYDSYYLIWKELYKFYGKEEAERVVEEQLTGAIYINDFTNISLPYFRPFFKRF